MHSKIFITLGLSFFALVSCGSNNNTKPEEIEYPTKQTVNLTLSNYTDYLDCVYDSSTVYTTTYYLTCYGSLSFAIYDNCSIELPTSIDSSYSPAKVVYTKCNLSKSGYLDRQRILSPYDYKPNSVSGTITYWF